MEEDLTVHNKGRTKRLRESGTAGVTGGAVTNVHNIQTDDERTTHNGEPGESDRGKEPVEGQAVRGASESECSREVRPFGGRSHTEVPDSSSISRSCRSRSRSRSGSGRSGAQSQSCFLSGTLTTQKNEHV